MKPSHIAHTQLAYSVVKCLIMALCYTDRAVNRAPRCSTTPSIVHNSKANMPEKQFLVMSCYTKWWKGSQSGLPLMFSWTKDDTLKTITRCSGCSPKKCDITRCNITCWGTGHKPPILITLIMIMKMFQVKRCVCCGGGVLLFYVNASHWVWIQTNKRNPYISACLSFFITTNHNIAD